MKQSTGTHASGPTPQHGLSTAVARHLKSYYGGGPPKTASVLTRADPSRLGKGRAPLVGKPRCRLEEAIAAELVRAAEQALGCRVLAHRTQVIPESGIRIEILELAGPPERSSGLQVLGVGRS